MEIKSKYTDYVNSVLSDDIVTCQYTKDVCARYLSWFDRSDIEFRADKADKVINFVQNLEHFTG